MAERLLTLQRGEASPAPALYVVEPSHSRPTSGKIIPFRRPEPVSPAFEDAPAQQLALF
ncbi:MAG: hypothetical protein IPK19_24950 [Chloroflexi bacterium]|nr:hypothetical protein [Chloroflexota bacterium]